MMCGLHGPTSFQIGIKNTRLKFESDYLADILGLQTKDKFPNEFPTKDYQIKGRTDE